MATTIPFPTQKDPVPKENDAALSSIGEISSRFGFTLRALRFYEQRGLLKPIRCGTSRYYDDAQILRLQTILKGKQLGFTLTEISNLVATTSRPGDKAAELHLDKKTILTQLKHLEQRRAEIDTAIAQLQAALPSPSSPIGPTSTH